MGLECECCLRLVVSNDSEKSCCESIPRDVLLTLAGCKYYVNCLGKISVYELWQHIADLLDMRGKWGKAVQEAGLDAIIHPAIPMPATTHGMSAQIACISYMLIGPMLLWPTGVLPVTTVREEEQHYYESKEMRDQLPKNQRDHVARLTAKEMKGSAGMPINISVLAPAYKDETCLRVMKEVERVMEFKARPTAYKA